MVLFVALHVTWHSCMPAAGTLELAGVVCNDDIPEPVYMENDISSFDSSLTVEAFHQRFSLALIPILI